LTEDQVRELLLKRAKKHIGFRGSGLNGWCLEHGVNKGHASQFMNGRRGPGIDLLEALNLEYRIVRKRKP
jgi:hypothetical protein